VADQAQKGAIGFGSAHQGGTPKADPAAPWNGPRAVSAAAGDRAALRRIHAWVDLEGNPDARSSYKLPHHKADGTVVLRGVRAAVGAVLGARGGVEIPGADKRPVFNHLAQHLREFEVEPPEFVQRAFAKFESGEVIEADELAKVKGWALNGTEQSFRTSFQVKKIDDELGIVFGWASVSEQADGSLVFDHEGDAIFPEELEKAAYQFNLEARRATDSHDIETLGAGDLVESMVFTKDKQDQLGISVPVGWWVGFHVGDEDMRKQIRDTGERAMFSIGGTALRTEI